jgi:hypothetical protein
MLFVFEVHRLMCENAVMNVLIYVTKRHFMPYTTHRKYAVSTGLLAREGKCCNFRKDYPAHM